MGLFRNSEASAVQLGNDEPLVQHDPPGVLLRVRPFKENEGIVDGDSLLQTLHDVKTSMIGRNVSDAHAFEIWYHEGRLMFHLHAADRNAAEKFERRVRATYPNIDVHEVEGEATLPPIGPEDHVAAAYTTMTEDYYLPIKNHESEGFEHDPYSEILAEMVSTDDTRVITQVVFRAAKNSWTQGGLLNGQSVDEYADGVRKGEVVGWMNPDVRDPSKKDKEAARVIEEQRGKQGFHVNIRAVAISPDKHEAQVRANGVAKLYGKFYNSVTEQGLNPVPVGGGMGSTRKKVKSFMENVRERNWTDRDMIMTTAELAGVAHIPNEDVSVPAVDWSKMVSGSGVPADSPQAEDILNPEEDDDVTPDDAVTETLNADDDDSADGGWLG